LLEIPWQREVERWLRWYNSLTHPDKINVGRVLRESYGWINNGTCRFGDDNSLIAVVERVGDTRADRTHIYFRLETDASLDVIRDLHFLGAASGNDNFSHSYSYPRNLSGELGKCYLPDNFGMLILEPGDNYGREINVSVSVSIPHEMLKPRRRTVLYRIGQL